MAVARVGALSLQRSLMTIVPSIILLLFTGATVSAQTVKVKTPRGAEVAVAINVPGNLRGKAAAVVIAPGQGYHMDLPIVEDLAKKVSASGVIAFRFNWGYFTADPQKGAPSADLSREFEDLQAVLNFAKADARVDASQILIAGKSMGSVVAYRAFLSDASAKALLLLTPLCSRASDDNGKPLPAPVATAGQNYPRFAEITKPVVLVLGNADPLCSPPALYDFLKNTKGNASAIVIGGDHGWNLSSATDAASMERNAKNIAEGVEVAAHWINLILQR
jgi:dienelactone hydrolase